MMVGTVAGMARKTHLIFALAGALFAAGLSTARAETVSLVAHLLGAAAIPPNKSDAFGEAQFTYDSQTRQLDYYVTYDGASPTKIDIHGPAGPGATAMAIASFPLSESPVTGKTILTREQGDSLLAGKLYIDLHSQACANGEIRGQIGKQ
jgi:CHRD domain